MVEQEVPASVEGCDTVMSGWGSVRRGWSVGSIGTVDNGEGRLQLVFFCTTRDKTKDLGLGKQKERRIFVSQSLLS